VKASKDKKTKLPMSLTKRIVLTALAVAALAAVIYFTHYLFHYILYDKYEEYLTAYEYEAGTEFAAKEESASDVPGFVLVAENDILKLYTDTATANVAVYDKRNGSIAYSNPVNADEDTVANKSNINYLKSQLIISYYNSDVKSGNYDSYSRCVQRGQFSVECIENGLRYIYRIGDLKNKDGSEGISFEIPLEYRLDGDGLVVSIPTCAIKEYGQGSLYRIQVLRYMGASTYTDNGCIVVPNGSGSIINFNNGKTSAANYSQYIYDLDPVAANYTTTENLDGARLALFGLCYEDRGILTTIEDGASTSLVTAGVSGVYNDLNYAYPTFVVRCVDNLRMFGDSSSDVFVLEEDIYDINLKVRYSFLTEEYAGYAGLANYYRERLINEGVLTAETKAGDIPFYYDVICALEETAHVVGTQYMSTFEMTTFEEAGSMAEQLKEGGINNQVINLQGWFNDGYYHAVPDDVDIIGSLGGKKGLEELNSLITGMNGKLYADVAFQKVTWADDDFNYEAEGSRYYGAGYVVSFGQVNPTTLRNTSGLGYFETEFDLLSPKFLPRYVEGFTDEIEDIELYGVSLRDLGDDLHSDKKRTNVIDREKALDIVLGQFDLLKTSGKKLMTERANEYALAYSSDIINVPVDDNDFAIIDASIPFYQMIIHGSIDYAGELLNYEDNYDLDETILNLIEAGASPHYVFTWEESSRMKDSGLNRYYTTTFSRWIDDALNVYERVNEALAPVAGSYMVDHEIFDNGVRKITYSNGVSIYINYDDEALVAEGVEIPSLGYRLEGK